MEIMFEWQVLKHVQTLHSWMGLAHILAFENPSAKGRYLMVESVAHYSEIVKILRELCPTMKLPEKCADDTPIPPKYQVNIEKAKQLVLSSLPWLKVSKKLLKA